MIIPNVVKLVKKFPVTTGAIAFFESIYVFESLKNQKRPELESILAALACGTVLGLSWELSG